MLLTNHKNEGLVPPPLIEVAPNVTVEFSHGVLVVLMVMEVGTIGFTVMVIDEEVA